MCRFSLLLVVFLICVPAAHAQVLVTGQTAGSGNGIASVSGNGILTDGIGIANNWGGVEIGVTDHADLFVGGGDFALLGRQFPYVLTGGLFGLPTKKFHFDTSTYQALIVPLYGHKNASTSIVNSAIIASKTLTVEKHSITPYVGASWLYSLGPKDRILSIPQLTFQIPFGISIPFGKKLGLTIEYDQGATKSLGFALSYSFRFRKQRSP